MKRRLLNFLTALSLLGCVLAAVIWAMRGRAPGPLVYRVTDETGRRTGDVSAWSWRGSLVVQVGRFSAPEAPRWAAVPPPGPAEYDRMCARPQTSAFDPSAARFAGFGCTTYAYTFWPYPKEETGPYAPTSVTNQVVMVPWYAIVLLTAAAPFVRLRRATLRRTGCATRGCAACGYDLTGNVSGTCPECGSPTNASA